MAVKMKCSCEFETNEAVIDKVRAIGADSRPMPTPAEIECDCGDIITMDTLVFQCPNCSTTYGVTPCSAANHEFIVKAAKGY